MTRLSVLPDADLRQIEAANPDARPRLQDCPYSPVAEQALAIAWNRGVHHANIAVKDALLAARRQTRSYEALGTVDKLARLVEEALRP